MKLQQATILEHRDFGAGYRLMVMAAPTIAAAAKPGQFVHVQVPGRENAVLRRPFSIFHADAQTFRILYKQVGAGTREMANLAEGASMSVIGPLGNAFPLAGESAFPLLVAGGYGVAPLYFLATFLPRTGTLFVGGRTAEDILCVDAFRALEWDVRITTEDGSSGMRGLVTDALDLWIDSAPEPNPVLYACGPDGLLRAVDQRAIRQSWQGWLSLDKHMGCGVGACLACVQRVHADDNTSQWKRVCKDGPIFASGEIFWGYGIQKDNV